MTIQPPWEEQGRRVPAWAMSAGLHMVVLLAAGLLWRNVTPVNRGITESSRTAAIVVAVSANGETDYFDEADAAAEEAAEAAAQAAAGGSAASQASDALPSMDQLPELPDIALPGAATGPTANDNLLSGSDLNVQGGTGGLPSDTKELEEQIRKMEAKGRPAPRPGTPARLTMFGAPSVGRSFVFCIDRSKSMGGGTGLGALLAAQKELGRGLAALGPEQRFEVVAYNHDTPETYGRKYHRRPGLVRVTPENLATVKDFFEGLSAFGSTKHHIGIYAALNLDSDVVYLLTDGTDPPTANQLRDMIGRARRAGTTFHCVQFGFGPLQEQDNFMMQLAKGTNGGYTYQRMDGAGQD